MLRRCRSLAGLLRAEALLGLARARGLKVSWGRRPIFWRGGVKIEVRGRLSIGERLKAYGAPLPPRLATGPEGEIRLGDRVMLNYGVEIYAARSVLLGDDVQIGDMSAVYDTDFHQVEEGSPVNVAPVEIGANVWLGRQVIVLPGVTIGDHAVVAAGSIVTRDVPPRTLVAGNPARVVRELTASDGWRRS